MGSAKLLFDRFPERPIAYYPVYTRICESLTAGILLSQVLYWGKVMQWKEFYKTDQDLRNEVCMGRHEFSAAKKKIQKLGFVTLKKKGWPARTFYCVRTEKVIQAISQLPEYQPTVEVSEKRT